MRIRTLVPVAFVAVLAAGACTAQTRKADPVRDARGFYLTTKKLDRLSEVPGDAAFKVRGVEGVFIRIDWNALETGPGVYDWRVFDSVAKRAIANGKRLSIGVIAGNSTPAWLADRGVPFGTFTVARQGCSTVRAPIVWSDAYVNAYASMMQAIKDHLVTIGGYNALSIVKITAIGENSLELRLPVNNRCSQIVDSQWAALGYRPAKVIAAWTRIADRVATIYPDKLLIQPILQVQGFPGVDESGAMIARDAVDTGNRIVRLCITNYDHRCGIQWNALKPAGKMAQRVIDARNEGAPIGWQSNLYLGPDGGAGCQVDRRAEDIPCTDATYTALLERGVDLGATFIEVWEPDVMKFPAAFDRAKAGWK